MNKNILTLLTLPLAASSAYGTTVATATENWDGHSWSLAGFTERAFETGDSGGTHSFVDVAATHGLTGQWIYAASDAGSTFTASITLSGIPAFDFVSIDQGIIGGGGGIDASQGDGVSVTVNGFTLANVTLDGRNRTDDPSNYGLIAPAGAILEAAASTDTNGAEFISTRNDGWGHDALYDLGQDPDFDNVAISGGGDVTIVITGNLTDGLGGSEGGNDEQIVIGNIGLSFSTIPEPSSALLALAAGLLPIFRRRR